MRSAKRLTQTVVERLPAPSPLRFTKGKRKGQPMPQIVWDSALKGFGVMVSATSPTKTFIVRVSVKGQAKRPRISLGKVGVLSVDDARSRALAHLKAATDGIDLKAQEKQAKKEGQTLQEALNRHVADCERRQIMKQRSASACLTSASMEVRQIFAEHINGLRAIASVPQYVGEGWELQLCLPPTARRHR